MIPARSYSKLYDERPYFCLSATIFCLKKNGDIRMNSFRRECEALSSFSLLKPKPESKAKPSESEFKSEPKSESKLQS